MVVFLSACVVMIIDPMDGEQMDQPHVLMEKRLGLL